MIILLGSIHFSVLNALNGLNEALCTSYYGIGEFTQIFNYIIVLSIFYFAFVTLFLKKKYADNGGRCREVCTRVAAVDGEGKWVFGRIRGDRRIFIVIEGCTTLNDMYSVVNDTFDTVLGTIMI